MFLIILGVLLFVLSSHLPVQLTRLQDPIKIKKSVRLAGISFLILGVFTSCVKQIDTGYVGVQSLFGKIQSTVLNSGLNIINPLVDVKDVDVRTQNYTMSGVHDEGEKSGDDAIRVLTRDGLEVTIDLSVLYRVNAGNAPKLIQMVGVEFKDKIIRPVTRTKIRDNAVYYDAV